MNSGPRPLAEPRREHILSVLREQGSARVAELALSLDVSQVTIRRDLELLEGEGLVERVHGGARPAETAEPLSPGLPEPLLDATAALPHLDGQIAMLVPSLDFYWPAAARAAEAEAKRYGLRLLLREDSYESEDERPALRPLFESADVLGVMAAPNVDGANAAAVLGWATTQGKPFVLLERQAVVAATNQPVESVASDHALGAEMAVRHLW
ncbi:MAG: DeoR family transcriptional regulator, partial [Bifidobacteriaceae bacterium]|nr:DeoR family transcriptional regulator [Bifidobacteriaceae bacterium]